MTEERLSTLINAAIEPAVAAASVASSMATTNLYDLYSKCTDQ